MAGQTRNVGARRRATGTHPPLLQGFDQTALTRHSGSFRIHARHPKVAGVFVSAFQHLAPSRTNLRYWKFSAFAGNFAVRSISSWRAGMSAVRFSPVVLVTLCVLF